MIQASSWRRCPAVTIKRYLCDAESNGEHRHESYGCGVTDWRKWKTGSPLRGRQTQFPSLRLVCMCVFSQHSFFMTVWVRQIIWCGQGNFMPHQSWEEGKPDKPKSGLPLLPSSSTYGLLGVKPLITLSLSALWCPELSMIPQCRSLSHWSQTWLSSSLLCHVLLHAQVPQWTPTMSPSTCLEV